MQLAMHFGFGLKNMHQDDWFLKILRGVLLISQCSGHINMI